MDNSAKQKISAKRINQLEAMVKFQAAEFQCNIFCVAFRQTLEEVDQFKCLGSTQAKGGKSAKEVTIRLVQVHSTMTRLAILWKNKAISFPTSIIFYTSLFSVLLYGCESLTLTADLERRMLQKDTWFIIQRT